LPYDMVQNRLILEAIAIFIAGLLLTAWAGYMIHRHEVNHQRDEALVITSDHANFLRLNIHQALSATSALAALVRQGNGVVPDFDEVDREIITLYPGIGAVQLTPDGIVQRIYPLSSNEKAIGHNLLVDPNRNKEAFLARDTGKLALAGPFNLIQGGLGAVERQPVLLPHGNNEVRFWGFTNVLIHFPQILDTFGLDGLAQRGYHYTLWRAHPDTGARQIIVNAGPELLNDPVAIEIPVPNGKWILSACRTSGWGAPMTTTLASLAGILISLLLAKLYTQMRQQTMLRQKINHRTQDLAASEARYRILFNRSRDALMTLAPPTWQFTDANQAALNLFGAKNLDEFSKLGPWQLSPERQPDGQPSRVKAQEEITKAVLKGSNFFDWEHQRLDGQRFSADVHLTRMISGEKSFLQATVRNISDQKAAQRKAARLAEYLAQVSRLATELIDLPLECIDDAINMALEQISNFFSADRAYVFTYNFAAQTTSNTHEWCAPGVSPQITNLQHIPLKETSEWVKPHLLGKSLSISNTANLPPGALRDILQPQGIESLLTVPMMRGNDCLGFVGLDAVNSLLEFGLEEAELLGTFAKLLVSVDQRRRAENEVREERQRLANILWGTNAGTWEWNVQTDETRFNSGWAKIIGRTLEELSPVSSKTWMAHTHPEDLTHAREMLQKHFSGKTETYECETRMRHKDGQWIWVLDRGRIISRTTDGKPLWMSGIRLDITERKRTEEALKESTHQLSEAQHIARIGSWELDLVQNKLIWSDEIFHIFEIDKKRFGASYEAFIDAVHPEDREAVNTTHTRSIKTNEPYEITHRLLMEDGRVKYVHERCKTQFDSEDRPSRSMGTVQDVTEQHVIEQALSALATTLATLTGNTFFESACRHLAEALGLDYAFVGRLNDVSNSVNIVAGWAQGRPMIPFHYELTGTPCAGVMERGYAIHPFGVQALFPKDELLAQMGIVSYVGSALFDKQHHPMGILVGLGNRPLQQTGLAEQMLGIFDDRVSAEMLREQAEKDLRANEEKFRTLVEATSDWIWEVDTNGNYTYVSPQVEHLLGYTPAEVIGLTPFDLMSPEEAKTISLMFKDIVLNGKPFYNLENTNLHKDGRKVVLETNGIPFFDENGNLIGYRGVDRDITARKQVEEQLRQAASVFDHTHEGIMITVPDGTIIDVNQAFCRITGFSHDEAVGENTRILRSGRHNQCFYAAMEQALKQNGYWTGEVWNRRKDGTVYAQLQTVSTIYDAKGEVSRHVSLFSDITKLKEQQHQLERIAHYDALTDLPNRVLLADRLGQAMAQVQRHDALLAVVYLDLDSFKAVNDAHGHDVGDKLLTLVSGRMKQTLREGDTLARLGGDEFVAVLLDLHSNEASTPILERLLAAAAEPVYIDGLALRVSASMGVSFFPQAGEAVDADQLMRQADQAMYEAKQAGKNRYHIFDAAHDQALRGHHENLGRIRQALENKEFILHYQPKVDMRSGQVIGAEALIRWQHPERGLLPPAAFLPVIQADSLCVELGDWVLETAAEQIEAWRCAGLVLPVSVNVDSLQFAQSDFMNKLQQCLIRHPGVQPGDLELEVLETSALEDVTRISEVITVCQEIGVGFALDDFGTGYSTLTYLRRLPAQLLKIDQSFVHGMLDNPEDLAILEGILGLANAFRRETIAEGVETAAHGAMLLSLGCHLAQGYGIARPMPANAVPGWIADWCPDSAWENRPRINSDDLPVLFSMVEYRAWVAALGIHLRDEDATHPPPAPHKYRFDQWLNNIGHDRYTNHPALARILTLHDRIHREADELVNLKQRDYANATMRFGEIETLRDELLMEMERLIW
jgi:diguanylate cyclase (GGDEF)-like protein/PAS domain S-box-containing protein